MPDHLPAAGSSCQRDADGGGYFAPLAPARYVLLTTFKRNGSPVSAPVRAVADGGRAYFHAWSLSGTVRRLRHTALVQVAPCTVLGLYSNRPAFYATARLLPGGEAGRAAAELARKYPAQHRFLIPLLHRAGRRQMLHYELLDPAVTVLRGAEAGQAGPAGPGPGCFRAARSVRSQAGAASP